MEDRTNKEGNELRDNMWNNIEKTHRRGKIMGGLLIVAIGALFLGRELGFEIPVWVFTWKMLLIGLGLTLAIKHRFMHPGWILLMGVGGAFLLSDLYPDLNIRPILWPSLLILVGLAIIFKPRRRRFGHYRRRWEKHHRKHWEKWYQHQHAYGSQSVQRYREYNREESQDDFIDSVVIMASVKKNVLTKNFKGGDVVNVFGGTELNLSQADFTGTARLELTQVFGGTKLIVPANWEIRSEQTVTIFGSVEDKRPTQPTGIQEGEKVLILTGTTVLGGVEIRSF